MERSLYHCFSSLLLFCATLTLFYIVEWNRKTSHLSIIHIIDKNQSNLTDWRLILEGLDLINSKNIVVNKTALSIKDLKIVTVFSLNHVQQAIKCCLSIRAHPELTKTKIIAYIFDDIHQDVLHIYHSLCSNIEIRHLKKLFEKYPDYVRRPGEYRYKHIITADTLKVEKLILYVDASILFKNSQGIKFESLINNFLTSNTIDAALFLPTSHSTFSVTHPKMYDFLPAATGKLKHLEQYMSGIILWVSTQKAKNLLHQLVWCSLERECMAPNGSDVGCWPHKIYGQQNWIKYADCHRYDQSAINLVLLNASNYNLSLFTYKNVYFSVARIPFI